MIISGFPGIGKSYLSKINQHIIDLESSIFPKDEGWEYQYINVAKYLSNQGYIVVISSHDNVRENLHNRNILFMLVYPERSLKNEYIQRYKKRNSDDKFIELLDHNWEAFIDTVEDDPNDNKIILKEGEYLANRI